MQECISQASASPNAPTTACGDLKRFYDMLDAGQYGKLSQALARSETWI